MIPETLNRDAVRNGVDAEVLASIREPGVQLAVWRRALIPELTPWLADLPPASLPRLLATLPVAEILPELHAACHASGMPRGAGRDALVADIAALWFHFARITACPRLRLRLHVLDNNACRRLHRDCVPLRLLCTYRGPGPAWVLPALAEQALAAGDGYDGALEHLGTYDVAIFKGCGFGAAEHNSGIVHRSPRIEGSGITRLVLCLDPAA